MALDVHRDPEGAIGRKYGDTIISTLRAIYGASFAPNCQPTDMLSDVLPHLEETSLQRLVEDHEAGRLNDKLVEKA